MTVRVSLSECICLWVRHCWASTVTVLTKVGLKGGVSCRCSRAFQSVLLKKLCCLMFPFTPRRSSGSLTNNCSTNQQNKQTNKQGYKLHMAALDQSHQLQKVNVHFWRFFSILWFYLVPIVGVQHSLVCLPYFISQKSTVNVGGRERKWESGATINGFIPCSGWQKTPHLGRACWNFLCSLVNNYKYGEASHYFRLFWTQESQYQTHCFRRHVCLHFCSRKTVSISFLTTTRRLWKTTSCDWLGTHA